MPMDWNAPHVAGVRQVLRAIRAEQLQCAVLALDAAPPIRRQVEQAARAAQIPLHTVATMEELGQLCRLNVPTAAAGLLKSPDNGA